MNAKTVLALAGILVAGGSALAQTGSKPPADSKDAHKEPPKKEAPKDEKKAALKDIVDTAAASPDHKHFVEALKHVGWDKELRGTGPFTVFGPNDKAFDATGKWNDWMKPENKDALANILKYHVIKGAKVTSAEVMKMKESVPTVQGGKITIAVKDGKVWLNGDKISVTKADIEASNGIIHVIDGVLTPPPAAAPAPKKEEPKKGH